MTPATLALITAVGPPDCATNKFPAKSAIVRLEIARALGSERPQNARILSKSSRHLANGEIGCQKGNPAAGSSKSKAPISPTQARDLISIMRLVYFSGAWCLELGGFRPPPPGFPTYRCLKC